MTDVLPALDQQLKDAIRHFWTVRQQQAKKQGRRKKGAKDRGQRGAVTGGKQMDGFIRVVHALLVQSGLNAATIFCRRTAPDAPKPKKTKRRKPKEGEQPLLPASTCTELPGWFRPEKDWDLVVVVEKKLIAAIEFKSQVARSGTISTTGPRKPWVTPPTCGPLSAKERSPPRSARGSAI